MRATRTMLSAAFASTALVLPFVYLELRNGSQNSADFPYPLFIVLWALPAASLLSAIPVVRTLRAGRNVLDRPGVLAVRVAFLILAAWFWVGLVNDQMPCFLGVPNCD